MGKGVGILPLRVWNTTVKTNQQADGPRGKRLGNDVFFYALIPPLGSRTFPVHLKADVF
jgi:hypothetical protein